MHLGVVVGDEGGHLPPELRLELLPPVGGVEAVDGLFAAAQELPDPEAQVVLGVGRDIGERVGEDLLPAAGRGAQPLGVRPRA